MFSNMKKKIFLFHYYMDELNKSSSGVGKQGSLYHKP